MATEYTDWASQSSPVQWDADFIDLDALPKRSHRAIGFNAERYDLANGEDLSLTDQENLRRLFVKLWEVEHSTGDEDGMLTPTDAAVAQRLDRRVCEIAILGLTGDKPMTAGERAELVASMDAQQRNAVRNAFFKGFDGIGPYAARVGQLYIAWLREQLDAAAQQAQQITSEAEEVTATTPTSVSDSSTATSEIVSKRPSRKRKTSVPASPSATRAA